MTVELRHKKVWGLAVLVALAGLACDNKSIPGDDHSLALIPNNLSSLPRVACIGDSFSKEYQFEGRTGMNFVEQLGTGPKGNNLVNFGAFQFLPWDNIRGRGYEYNWAQFGATLLTDMRVQLHSGGSDSLLAQVQSGKVQYVVILLGGNDFEAILKIPESDADKIKVFDDLPAKEEKIFADAIGELEAAANGGQLIIAISTLEDLGPHGASYGTPGYAHAAEVGWISQAMLDQADMDQSKVNDWIRNLGWTIGPDGKAVLGGKKDAHVVCVDFQKQLREIESKPSFSIPGHDGNVTIHTTANPIDPSEPNDPHNLWLDDQEHIGTVEQALWGNLIIADINAVNAAMGNKTAEIGHLSNDQILKDAGLDQ